MKRVALLGNSAEKVMQMDPKKLLKANFAVLYLPTSLLMILGKREMLTIPPWHSVATILGIIGLIAFVFVIISTLFLFRKGVRYGVMNVGLIFAWICLYGIMK
jgi:NADH:ubiquinone oxidoreductase subunit 3 (subunit A)